MLAGWPAAAGKSSARNTKNPQAVRRYGIDLCRELGALFGIEVTKIGNRFRRALGGDGVLFAA